MSPRIPYLDHPRPLVLAHRGLARDDGPLDGAENTLAAFHAAVEAGCTHVETDVHATADGVVVAFHDDDLDRVTDRSGAIADLPWREVRVARIAGEHRVPTLRDVLTDLPDTFVNIDVKDERAAVATAEVINELRAHGRVCIGSFSDQAFQATIAHLERAPAMSGSTSVVQGWVMATRLADLRLPSVARRAARRALADVDVLQVPELHEDTPVVTPRSIELAHEAGVDVHVWTVNDRADMARLLDWGVDGIVSDRADVALQVAADRRTVHDLHRA